MSPPDPPADPRSDPARAPGGGAAPSLRRTVGLPGAVLLGLGSIVGTGAYVSLAIAAGVAGAWLPLAVLLAGGLAACNGLSSANLAAVHPVAGGTYAYARRFLTPGAGVAAGWLFLAAKSASAATAALGIGGYAAAAAGLEGRGAATAIALGVVAVATALAAGGLRRSNAANAIVVLVAIGGLVVFAIAALSAAGGAAGESAASAPAAPGRSTIARLPEAVALVFVAYTGYGRVATLGEEIRDPARSIPRAVVLTLTASLGLYLLVAIAALHAVGAASFAAGAGEGAAAPLVRTLLAIDAAPWTVGWIEFGALAAMAGVLLNLLLGLSRVAFAMGRDRELPGSLARLAADGSPRRAVVAIGTVIALLTLVGDVRVTWSFSAATVLGYYGLTNLCALRLAAQRRVPRTVALAGLAGCGGLAWCVEPAAWIAGLAVVAVPLAVRAIRRGR